jgi:hypothetical protein
MLRTGEFAAVKLFTALSAVRTADLSVSHVIGMSRDPFLFGEQLQPESGSAHARRAL